MKTFINIPQLEFDGFAFTSECTLITPFSRFEGYTTKVDESGVQEPIVKMWVSMEHEDELTQEEKDNIDAIGGTYTNDPLFYGAWLVANVDPNIDNPYFNQPPT